MANVHGVCSRWTMFNYDYHYAAKTHWEAFVSMTEQCGDDCVTKPNEFRSVLCCRAWSAAAWR